MNKLGWSLDSDENVVLRMTQGDYNFLIFALGIATGADVTNTTEMVKLINKLNEGNPNFKPYKTE